MSLQPADIIAPLSNANGSMVYVTRRLLATVARIARCVQSRWQPQAIPFLHHAHSHYSAIVVRLQRHTRAVDAVMEVYDIDLHPHSTEHHLRWLFKQAGVRTMDAPVFLPQKLQVSHSMLRLRAACPAIRTSTCVCVLRARWPPKTIGWHSRLWPAIAAWPVDEVTVAGRYLRARMAIDLFSVQEEEVGVAFAALSTPNSRRFAGLTNGTVARGRCALNSSPTQPSGTRGALAAPWLTSCSQRRLFLMLGRREALGGAHRRRHLKAVRCCVLSLFLSFSVCLSVYMSRVPLRIHASPSLCRTRGWQLPQCRSLSLSLIVSLCVSLSRSCVPRTENGTGCAWNGMRPDAVVA